MSVDQSFPMGLGAPLSSLGSDFAATGKLYPGYIAQPVSTETGGLYSAWREISGSQWTLQNADIGPSGFFLANPALPGWAFNLLSGGGYQMLTAPAGSAPGFAWTVIWYVNSSGAVIVGGGGGGGGVSSLDGITGAITLVAGPGMTIQNNFPVARSIELSSTGGGGAVTFTTDLSGLTIYNYGAFGASLTGPAATNSTAMINMLAAAGNASPVGGACLIPQGNFSINPGPSGGYQVPDQTSIVGTGNQAGNLSGGGGTSGTNCQLSMTGDGVLFQVGGPHTSGGVYFSNLVMGMGATATSLSTTAIMVQHNQAWNVRALKCNFINFPTAMNCDSLSSGLEQCTINYSASSINNAVMVRLGAPQCYAIGPGEILMPSGGTGNGNTGISLESGLEHGVVRDYHISYFAYGINYAYSSHNTVNFTHVSNVEVQSFINAVNMVPSDTHGTIYGEKYTSCLLALAGGATSLTPVV
jgi:hypothetical protein